MLKEECLNKFINLVGEKNFLQKKYLKAMMDQLKTDEKNSLIELIDFYLSRGYSLEDIAGTWLLFIQVVMEETKYFAEHGEYRYHSFAEVSDDVYFNHTYMTKYMMGLALSTYLLNFHLLSMRWFGELIEKVSGDNYLEIGPGHGEYFYYACCLSKLKLFKAIDLSPASIEMTECYMNYRMKDIGEKRECFYECADFLKYECEDKWDAIVMGEVLEHVERPDLFLRKIASLSHKNTFIYVTTVINAPERDHIYLFHDFEEITSMVEASGLSIKEYRLITHNDKPLEKVMNRKEPVMVAMQLKRI